MLQLQEQLEQARKESAALRCTGMDVKPVQQPLGDELASVSVLHAVTGEVRSAHSIAPFKKKMVIKVETTS